MTTHASRDTTTGLKFEEIVNIKCSGIPVAKYKLYKHLKEKGINYKDIISKRLLPDDAYIDYDNSTFYIFEKKFQEKPGSADEKPQTCAFKIFQFRKIATALGLKDTYYIYILSDWFKKPEYKDMLDYIKTVDGCDYLFYEGEDIDF